MFLTMLSLALFALACQKEGESCDRADGDIPSDGDMDAESESTEDTDADFGGDADAWEIEFDGDADPESEFAGDAEPDVEEGPEPGVFRLPLADAEGHYSEDFILGVDHDPEVHEGLATAICQNYMGDTFPNCYDEHKGTDYILKGSFETMDREVAFVYAAAAGRVTDLEDGNYDRCHTDTDNPTAGNISCDGHPIRANFVRLEHENGLVTRYYHLKTDSIRVSVGETVACGQVLGLVGSSGISALPHLHFQVEDADGAVIDPYAGPYSQERSYWVEQDSGNGLPGETCPER